MRAIVATAAGNANSGTDARVGRSPDVGGSFIALRKRFRALWPIKTAHQVSQRAHISVRSAERFLSSENELSTAAIIHLLRSDHGLHFLVDLMGRARPAWWANLLRMGMLGGIERRREADLRLLRKIVDADKSTAAELPSATVFQDEEFYRPFLEGLAAHSDGGTSDGPMARKGRGR